MQNSCQPMTVNYYNSATTGYASASIIDCAGYHIISPPPQGSTSIQVLVGPSGSGITTTFNLSYIDSTGKVSELCLYLPGKNMPPFHIDLAIENDGTLHFNDPTANIVPIPCYCSTKTLKTSNSSDASSYAWFVIILLIVLCIGYIIGKLS